jgi:hypothetical protein
LPAQHDAVVHPTGTMCLSCWSMGFCDPLQQPASVHVCCFWCTSVACVQVQEALYSYPCCSTQLNNTFHVVIGHHWAPSWQRAARRPADGTPGFLALACTSLVWAKSKSRDSARRGLLQPASARGALRQRCLWTWHPFLRACVGLPLHASLRHCSWRVMVPIRAS